MKLWHLAPQNKAVITHCNHEIDGAYKQRLTDLGFRPGEIVECVRHLPFSGPRVYMVQSTIYALEMELAEMICVNSLNESVND